MLFVMFFRYGSCSVQTARFFWKDSHSTSEGITHTSSTNSGLLGSARKKERKKSFFNLSSLTKRGKFLEYFYVSADSAPYKKIEASTVLTTLSVQLYSTQSVL